MCRIYPFLGSYWWDLLQPELHANNHLAQWILSSERYLSVYRNSGADWKIVASWSGYSAGYFGEAYVNLWQELTGGEKLRNGFTTGGVHLFKFESCLNCGFTLQVFSISAVIDSILCHRVLEWLEVFTRHHVRQVCSSFYDPLWAFEQMGVRPR